MRLIARSTVLLTLFVWFQCTPTEEQTSSLVNFAHLNHLTEEIELDGEKVSIVHIYAEYPDYRWKGAAESGPEGIACVDDAARAAVVYLRQYELTGDEQSATKAIALLRFLLKMQADDGQFYNFIFSDRSVNREGKTSYRSFGWWAARGVWALSLGNRVLKEKDPFFAGTLRAAVENTFPHIKDILNRYNTFQQVKAYKVPRWLIYQYDQYSASATSELVIGLCEFYAADPQPRVKGYIEKFAEAFVAMQAGDFQSLPYGAFLSEALLWHDWANGQTQALAMAARLFQRSDWLQAAKKEVRWFYPRLLIEGRFRELSLANGALRREFPQIAYGARPMVLGALRVADATGNRDYEKLAGILASWFFGNNATGKPLYDAQTGRCYDGIEDSSRVNLNSGAESTVEALYAILEAEQYPLARKYFSARKIRDGKNARYSFAVFGNDAGDTLTVALDLEKGDVLILQGAEDKKLGSCPKSVGSDDTAPKALR